jgi:3-hydroxyacyl-[acyl-carrier-protein] dehydratase
MSSASADPANDTLARVTMLIRRDLKLGPDVPVTEDMPFFGGEADIDSLDILLLLSSIEKEFALRIPSEAVGREVFANVGTLVRYIEQQRPVGGGAGGTGDGAGKDRNANDFLSRLPHGEGFRFISRVDSVKDGVAAEGVWQLTGSEAFFAGHFPGQPLVPGVLIAEALAQISGLAAGVTSGQGRLAHVDVRFEQPVPPPAEIRLESRLTRTMGGLRQFEVTARLGEMVVARGTVALSFG